MRSAPGRRARALAEGESPIGIECALPAAYDAGHSPARAPRRGRRRLILTAALAAAAGLALWGWADSRTILDLLADLTGLGLSG
jgi:ferric-dicitrate binding protein FerR (iron transport regulator)